MRFGGSGKGVTEAVFRATEAGNWTYSGHWLGRLSDILYGGRRLKFLEAEGVCLVS